MPTEAELAAIYAALDQLSAAAQREAAPAAAWKTAMRHPELEFDDLRSVSRGGVRVR